MEVLWKLKFADEPTLTIADMYKCKKASSVQFRAVGRQKSATSGNSLSHAKQILGANLGPVIG